MWCLNSRRGFLVYFDLHQGTNPRGNRAYESLFETSVTTKRLPATECCVIEFMSIVYLQVIIYSRAYNIWAVPQLTCPLTEKKIFSAKESHSIKYM